MRVATTAAAGAALIAAVSAASHEILHAKLHEKNVARDWLDWNTTAYDPVVEPAKTETTTDASVPAETTTDPVVWEVWTPATSQEVDPVTTETVDSSWADWTAETTSSIPVDPVDATTTTPAEHIWADWTTTSSVPVDGVTATTSTTTTEEPWLDWTATSDVPVDPVTTATDPEPTWGDWTSDAPADTPVDPDSTSSDAEETWGDWATDAPAPVDPTETVTETWGDWATDAPAPVDPTETETQTVSWGDWVTDAPVDPADTTTWGDWTAPEETTIVVVSSIITETVYVEPASSEPASCAIVVITSYGPATWYPTPVIDAETTSSSSTDEPWADWTATTSSIPVEAETTTTYDVWADWTTTTSDPVDAETTTAEPWLDWSAETESAVATASVESSTPSASGTPPKHHGGPGGAPGISANGDSWAMTYSPYTAEGGCKDAGTVAADLAKLASIGFSALRIYSTDCSILEYAGTSARENGLSLIIGVWISASGIAGAHGQVDDIVAWAQWDLVQLIVVGNEAVFNGYVTAGELAGFVASSAAAFKGAGYAGLVTLTEPLSIWEDESSSSAFCSVVDVIGANLYAFFNADVTADKAGGFIQAQIDILNTICSGKPVYVLESGWPHAGNCNGVACPSPENQAIALKGIQETVGAQVVFLSFEDEPWKEPGPFGVEQYWGCAGVF